MHATAEKFGYPGTLLRELEHWLILLRPAQPTLGCLVLVAKSDVTEFSALPTGAHAELAEATQAIETALKQFTDYAKINYLMLMMVDPQVHFHVIPRYQAHELGRHGEGRADDAELEELAGKIAEELGKLS